MLASLVGSPVPSYRIDALLPGQATPIRLSLDDFRTRWVVLSFYPARFSADGLAQLGGFAALADAFEREHAVVIGATPRDFLGQRAAFVRTPVLQGVRYPVMADVTGRLAGSFGVLDGRGDARRATFVIDPTGVVRDSVVSDGDAGRGAADTLRVLRALRGSHAPGAHGLHAVAA
jgi:alkyl hydroperoxide reductase subunit AhpC